MRRKILAGVGILYVLFGLLAFVGVPGLHASHHHTTAHNITHIVLGVIIGAVAIQSQSRGRRILCVVFAIGYIALVMIGLAFPNMHNLTLLPGVLAFAMEDRVVYGATACFFGFLAAIEK